MGFYRIKACLGDTSYWTQATSGEQACTEDGIAGAD